MNSEISDTRTNETEKFTQPNIQVGIMAGTEISIELQGKYTVDGIQPPANLEASIVDHWIVLRSGQHVFAEGEEFLFLTPAPDCSFLLKGVTIGIDFHWEQKQDLQFRGSLKLMVEDGKVRAINIVPLEEYLRSVISSEMSATSSPELLKAHAVISRSWLLAQLAKSKKLKKEQPVYQTTQQSEGELIRWYDREDHALFDVCADDHCQRYQGITKIISDKANAAIDATFGEVLMSRHEICDTRFSKCCGGISENFENVWEPVLHSYLTHVADAEQDTAAGIDLRQENQADAWIRSSPPAFCNTTDQQVLAQVLPDFDQATSDFYRWQVSYTQKELSALIRKKTGIDFGQIISLEPMERGYSGRLIRLKITGTLKTMIIGKELEIRRALSESHLYSSAFVVDQLDEQEGIPQQFVLTGAGWGHGVGLCQIGAAMMGEKGYSYEQILKHYFRGAELKKRYAE
ncbi:SpoIID/LytB domain-containing protein [Gaoshiqia sediminis]|uniref:SpoIID/LytB domain-containing protein n=1 Tax=Gaoshiqia sediminis TaxID=2986998 RepID=A0AA41YCZ6_9BACT|nr:SpoIID/LytB domain-containing protein [Gaoshiqia sediminis]MCW0484240.1 SpoIID/LytB domain-containing protein [Gaoshiqia sediminis]